MSDLCQQFPDLVSCLANPEPRPVFVCSGCSHGINEGEFVWHIMGEQFCNQCIRRLREVAVFDGD